VGHVSASLGGLLGNRAEDRMAILVYHRVAPVVPGAPAPTINVSPDRFRSQLAGLLERGYAFWPLAKVLEHRASGRPVPPRTVVVTFDDGFESVYLHAWPILQELGVPATVFVATAYLDAEEPFPFDEWGTAFRRVLPPSAYRPLSTAECRQMLGSGSIEIGSHTHTHADFRERPRALADDVRCSLEVLGARFGLRRPTFAFPYGRRHLGYVSDPLIAAARSTGIAAALTSVAELVDSQTEPFGWGRFTVYDWDTPATLAARCQGWYGWAPGLQEWLSSRRWRQCGSVTGAPALGDALPHR
jgi:peptidoglycan/xylan/chitin deacetylase (PgdA/CDA1 family)